MEKAKTLDDGKITGDLDVSKISKGEQESEALGEVAGSIYLTWGPLGMKWIWERAKLRGV